MAYTIKLSRYSGVTRRVPFPSRPSWAELAAKIQAYYSITPGQVGVSYLDRDGDEVTLSSQEELEEYYSSLSASDTVKFTVVDLSASRQEKILPDTPTSRNTFGGPNIIYDIDEDWSIPIREPFVGFDREGSLHAYVETIDSASNLSRAQEEAERSASFRAQERLRSQDTRPLVSTSPDLSSTASIINSDLPTKPSIHVAAHGLHNAPSGTFGPVNSTYITSSGIAAPSLSAPDEDPSSPSVEMPDPPTPEIRPDAVSTAAASLANDIASLLDSLGAIFDTQPQLTESVRKILRKVQNGSYWTMHPESAARAAEDIRRASLYAQAEAGTVVRDMQQEVEEQSRRRMANAIANVLRIFTDTVTGAANPAENENGSPSASPPLPSTTALPPTFSMPAAPSRAQHSPALDSDIPSINIPALPPTSRETSQPTPIIPPWSVFKPYDPQPSTQSRGQIPKIDTQDTMSRLPDVSFYSATSISPTLGRMRPKAAELKASLEVAKENYKREKERYRREREERRRLRRTREANEVVPSGDTAFSNAQPAPSVVLSVPLPAMQPSTVSPSRSPRQIISNARGGFPQMEIVELSTAKKSPKRQPTVGVPSSLTMSQAMRSIVEKLERMGFSEDAYPSLGAAIHAHLPTESKISEEKENDVVSEIIEDLLSNSLARAPRANTPPRASGSGTRPNDASQ